MGKKALMVPIGKDGRLRITVDLQDRELACLQNMFDSLNCHAKQIGISAVVRAALRDFHRNGDWTQARTGL